MLLDLLGWRVLDELALLVEAGPLGKAVGDIDAALAVEHVKSEKKKKLLDHGFLA